MFNFSQHPNRYWAVFGFVSLFSNNIKYISDSISFFGELPEGSLIHMMLCTKSFCPAPNHMLKP